MVWFLDMVFKLSDFWFWLMDTGMKAFVFGICLGAILFPSMFAMLVEQKTWFVVGGVATGCIVGAILFFLGMLTHMH